ncbi:tetratricopeptide repeat protein, partial [Undibacterium sp. TJN19]|uniref:tetratricopeptide repeat protein n=1 Tax=Undibacterium sp. TJN19 TaxID=3413055 RepID=UPI003BF0792E
MAFADSPSPLVQQLKEQAQFWQQRGRDDNAADAWRKLLKIDGSNVDALMALAIHEAKAGNPEQAKTYFTKLRGSQATSAQIRQVEDNLRRGGTDGVGQLDNARKLAKQGDTEAAVDAFKQMGDPSKLHGDAAYEYYQVLVGSKAGYAEAKKGLEKLSRENPANAKYALAYAQSLTYRENSRAEGMALLEGLSTKPELGKQATESWRQSLSWMGLKTENAKYFRNYLDKHPDDKFIQDRLGNLTKPRVAPSEEVRATDRTAEKNTDKAVEKPVAKTKVVENPIEKLRVAGFKALDENNVAEAETEFQTLIKSYPKNPTGYGGMGLVKMRQEEFIEARGFLQKAVDFSPGQSKDQWRKAYEDASYWAIVAEARTAFEDGDSVKGIAFLRKAIALNGTEPAGILQLADALQAENDLAGAEENYRRVLNADKENLRALDGVIGVLVLQKRLADLEALSSIMLPRHLAIVANLKSEELWNKAKAAEAAGDLNAAQVALEDAIMVKPDNAWLRMALAKIYLKRDMPGQARALIDAMVNVENPDPEALYVSALLSEMQQLWWEALITLERVPPASRKKEMADMQKRLWVRVQLDRVELLMKRGNVGAAKGILATVEPVTGNDPEFTGTMANLYIQLGDNERGYAMIRQAVQNTPKPSAGLLLQYAGTLMQANQEGELEAVMRRVAAMPKLEEAEISAFQQLQRILSMRYAERAREAGDYANAYNYIQPLLIANPDDNMLLLTLARLYNASGDTESGRELYRKVLQSEPENPEVLQGLVYAAIQAKDFSSAERYLSVLMRLQPRNPRYVSMAGNVARAQGNNSRALSYFKEALALERAQKTEIGAGPNGLRLVEQGSASTVADYSVNPFSGRQAAASPQNPQINNVAPAPSLKPVPTTNYNSGIFAPVGKPLTPQAVPALSGSAPPMGVTPANLNVPQIKTVPALPATQVLSQQPPLQQAPAPVKAPVLGGGGGPADPAPTAGDNRYASYPAQLNVAQYTPAPSYVAPKASYSNSYAAPAPVPQQYAAATGNSGTGSKARATKPVTNVSAEEAGLLKEIDAI